MNINKITITGSIIAIFFIITIPTVYKVVKNHQDNLYHVIEDKIINSAKKCYYEENCKNEKITLNELYALNYLEKVSNPITKEYYNEKSFVEKKESDFKFIPVE